MIDEWRALGSVAPEELNSARLELHHAVQAIASFGQGLVAPRDDDSHRSMTWDDAQDTFLSEPTVTSPELRVSLGPDDLNLSVFSDGEQVISRSLLAVSIEEMYRWLEDELRNIPGVSQELVLAPPEFDLPHHPVVDGEYFYGGDDDAALPELTRWYHNASALLRRVRADEPHATPVRCWPHHFDIATLIVLDPEIGATTGRSVGVGFSPGDGGYPQPYWYVTPFPRPEDPQLPELPSGGHWHSEGWLGAVLTGGRIVEADDPAAQSKRVSDFVQVAVQTAKSLLTD